MNNKLPAVPVHDIVIHPRDHDMIVGTHGRSMYIAEVKELQQLTADLMAKKIHAFDMNKIRASSRWGNNTLSWREVNDPDTEIPLYASSAGKASIQIKTTEGITLSTFEADLKKGLNYIKYDLIVDQSMLKGYNEELNKKRKKDAKPINVKAAKNGKAYIYKGKYTVLVEKDGEEVETSLVVE